MNKPSLQTLFYDEILKKTNDDFFDEYDKNTTKLYFIIMSISILFYYDIYQYQWSFQNV